MWKNSPAVEFCIFAAFYGAVYFREFEMKKNNLQLIASAGVGEIQWKEVIRPKSSIYHLKADMNSIFKYQQSPKHTSAETDFLCLLCHARCLGGIKWNQPRLVIENRSIMQFFLLAHHSLLNPSRLGENHCMRKSNLLWSVCCDTLHINSLWNQTQDSSTVWCSVSALSCV